MKTAIVLNGTSSSGKTSIARSIQRLCELPVLHVSLDAFTDMFDWPSVSEDDKQACHELGLSNFNECLAVIAGNPLPIVIDHVFERDEWAQDCFRALEGRAIFFVGVHCSLPVLKERERQRGNRKIGLAKYQYDVVHKSRVYDLEVDTSLMTPDEAAAIVLAKSYIQEQ